VIVLALGARPHVQSAARYVYHNPTMMQTKVTDQVGMANYVCLHADGQLCMYVSAEGNLEPTCPTLVALE
jgi:hypothetical protein